MASTVCAACGFDLPDLEARFCSSCGASVPGIEPIPDDEPDHEAEGVVATDVPEAPAPEADGPAEGESGSDAQEISGDLTRYSFEVPLRHRLTDEQWQYATWGAVAVGAVAIVALVAVVFGLLSSNDDAPRAPFAAASESTTTTTVVRRTGMINEFPVSYPSTVEYPKIGDSAGYHQDRAFIAFRLTVDTCERSDGMLKVGGSIRNETLIGQTLDYHIAVEITRRVVGTSLASLDTTVEGLGPRETAEWGVEAVSTKTVNVACDVVALTVAPSETG
jgi:hypothetical protein